MTPLQTRQIAALGRCKFSPGSTAKRFVRTVGRFEPEREMTVKGAAMLNRLAHSYRKQIGECLAAPCDKCGTQEAPETDRVEHGTQMGLFGGAR